MIFRISKQQLNTDDKENATNGNSVGNPVLIKEEISCLAILFAQQLNEIGPRKTIVTETILTIVFSIILKKTFQANANVEL